YRHDLVPAAWDALGGGGWVAPGTIVVAECARDEGLELPGELLAERIHGAARISVWRPLVIKG
ncbi:16S rRNA (guanine(966)-N(2))-methyltransferase RsmD, partial [Ameyamaea chiangmaiensis]|nr:16S rRNA (guanine(966)-N(2))-methyltransferase RsmD [Ameyamaea chiangmaiensis]